MRQGLSNIVLCKCCLFFKIVTCGSIMCCLLPHDATGYNVLARLQNSSNWSQMLATKIHVSTQVPRNKSGNNWSRIGDAPSGPQRKIEKHREQMEKNRARQVFKRSDVHSTAKFPPHYRRSATHSRRKGKEENMVLVEDDQASQNRYLKETQVRATGIKCSE